MPRIRAQRSRFGPAQRRGSKETFRAQGLELLGFSAYRDYGAYNRARALIFKGSCKGYEEGVWRWGRFWIKAFLGLELVWVVVKNYGPLFGTYCLGYPKRDPNFENYPLFGGLRHGRSSGMGPGFGSRA